MVHLGRARAGVDHLEPWGRAIFNEHHPIQADGLTGMDLRVVKVLGNMAIVAPHHALVGCDFGHVLHPRKQDVAVGQHPDVVEFRTRPRRKSPDHLPARDEEHRVAVLSHVEHWMLRQSPPRQVRTRDPCLVRVGAHRLAGSESRNPGRGEPRQDVHAGSESQGRGRNEVASENSREQPPSRKE